MAPHEFTEAQLPRTECIWEAAFWSAEVAEALLRFKRTHTPPAHEKSPGYVAGPVAILVGVGLKCCEYGAHAGALAQLCQ
jgi:hypothetical protein